MNLYVSNLSYTVTDDQLRSAFEAYGLVNSVRVINDRETGRSRGFGFVEMPDNTQALAAISGLNDQDFGGRTMRVVEARPKEGPPGGGGGGAPRNFGGGAPGGGQRRDFGGGGGGGGRDWGDGGGARRGGGGGGGKGKDRGWDRNKRGGNSYDDDGGW